MNLFPTEAARRLAARAIARICTHHLVELAIVDDHVHVELVCEDTWALASLRSRLSRALAAIASGPIAPSYAVEVESRAHLRNNVSYFLTQTRHHGIEGHPAIEAGCCFQDLVGARLLPGFDPRVLKAALPRLRREDLVVAVGLPIEALDPLPIETLPRFGVSRIAAAASHVLAIDVERPGRSVDAVNARRAAIQLVDAAGMSRRDLVRALPCSERAIQRMAREPVEPKLLRAVRLRLSIEEAATAARRAS